MKLTKVQSKIVQVYIQIANQRGYYPSRSDMRLSGISRDMVRHHFGSFQELRRIAKVIDPTAFGNIIDQELFTEKTFTQLQAKVAKYKRFIITTAVTGCKAHEGFYKSLKGYCKRNSALLLILIAADSVKNKNKGWSIDKMLLKESIVCKELPLNSNIFISTIKLSAKQVDPISGLGRVGQNHGSFIYASPKQRLKPVPTSNVKMPRVLMTTGAITKPAYQITDFLHDKTAYVAEYDHVMGAVIVEVEDDKYYHFRQVQAEKDGSFVDLGNHYSGYAMGKMRPSALVLGDTHAGETDPAATKVWQELIKLLKPKTLVMHDVFTGFSINPHEREKDIMRARLAIEHKLYLESELAVVANAIGAYATKDRNIVIVESNHNEFLKRWLESSEFVKDPPNYKIGIELAHYMLNGLNPLQAVVERIGLKYPDKVKWLIRDEDYRVAGIECGAHGDKGANGSYGSLKTMEDSYGKSVSGHGHSEEILRQTWRVGTSTYLKLSYNTGPSSWTQTSCLIYPNGTRQLINCIDGKWRIK